MILIAAYLAAIVAANLSVAAFGPQVVILNAFLLIGLDLTLRDQLHDRWAGPNLWIRMGTLIAVGGLISYALNRDAGPIALASTVAFMAAAAADALVYAALSMKVTVDEFGRRVPKRLKYERGGVYTTRRRFTTLERMNGSNIVGSAVDSLVFPTLAFGGFMPLLVIGQFAAKVAGGFVWSLLIAISQRRRAARSTCDVAAGDGQPSS